MVVVWAGAIIDWLRRAGLRIERPRYSDAFVVDADAAVKDGADFIMVNFESWIQPLLVPQLFHPGLR